jgi:hypothetical protein
MRSLVAIGVLFFTATAFFGRDFFALPEPRTMFLIGVVGAGLLLALREKNNPQQIERAPDRRTSSADA